jgi:hypothetical protein
MIKNIFVEALITLVYYIVAYFIITYAFDVFPSSGGPSEAFFLLVGFGLLSIIIFIYCFVKLTKGDMAKIGSVITHLIAMPILLKLLM